MGSIIDLLARSQGHRSEQPNIDLAEKIVADNDKDAVAALIDHLEKEKLPIKKDCVKALYEIGERAPDLIAPYADVFYTLLDNKNNRLQWGGMCSLAAIAEVKADYMYDRLSKVLDIAEKGTVITRDHMVKILEKLALHEKYQNDILPLMIEQVLLSPVNQLPMYAERTANVMNDAHKKDFMDAVKERLENLEVASKVRRLEKVLAQMS